MLGACIALAFLTAGTPGQARSGQPRFEPQGPLSDSVRTERKAFLLDIRNRMGAIDRRLDSILADSLALYRADSVYRRQVLTKARTGRDSIETLMDDLAAVEGSLGPTPWDSLKANVRISLDSLQRLYLAVDSSAKVEQDRERRAKLDPHIEDIRSGGGREWRRERRDVEESRRGR